MVPAESPSSRWADALESGGSSKLSERAIRNFWHNYRQDMGL